MKNSLTLLLMVVVIGLIGCVPDVTPEVEQELANLPTTVESVYARRIQFEKKLTEAEVEQKNIMVKYSTIARSIAEVNAQIIWHEHMIKNGDVKLTEKVTHLQEMLTKLKLDKIALNTKMQEVLFGVDKEVILIGEWNKKRPGWWR